MAVYDRDYLTTLPLLYTRAAEYSLDSWNKYADDVGDTLLKLIASSSHTVDYYFRKFLTALVLPNDNWNHKTLIWELTGYKPNYLRADYMMVQLYWPDCGLDSYVPLYQYTPFNVVADGKEYTFLCAQDYLIPPLTTRTNVRLVNGSLVTIDQDYTLITDKKIKLSDNDIDYDLVTVEVSGIKWTQVRNVFYSPDTERIFSVHKEEDGTYLYLHRTWQTYVDSYDTSFKIYFVESRFDFELFTDECMKVTFSEPLLTVDGDDVTEYYRIIPLLNSDEAIDASNLLPSTTEGNRAITVLDFETNALLFPGIATCRAFDWNTPSVCNKPFEVVLVACDNKLNLSEHMKQVLVSYLESICSPLLTVRTIPPKFFREDIIVVLDIGDYRGTLAEKEIRSVVQNTLEDFYEIGNLPPGRVVKTKELNSLLLHADKRIYFATCSFVRHAPVNPIQVPILGDVIILTSAESFQYYDFGKGYDKGYIDFHQKELATFIDKFGSLQMFEKDKGTGGAIVPIDKLPAQAFDGSEEVGERSYFNLTGFDAFPIADFIVGNSFIGINKTGGSFDTDIKFVFIFETNGSAVLGKHSLTIDSTQTSQLIFQTSSGLVTMDPGLTPVRLRLDNIDEIKSKLATEFNNIPQLYDGMDQPFNITASDILYGNAPVGGSRLVHVTPKRVGNGLTDEEEDELEDVPPFIDPTVQEPLRNVIGGNVPEFPVVDVNSEIFVYVPYSNRILTDEEAATENAQFNTYSYNIHYAKNYQDFHYTAESSIYRGNVPTLRGPLRFTADVSLSVDDTITEYATNTENIYSEQSLYMEPYYVKDKSGNALHWYFVNTTPLKSVEGTYYIGYGIYVGFALKRDSAVYVETDPSTSRGFIYSSEFTLGDFEIRNSLGSD